MTIDPSAQLHPHDPIFVNGSLMPEDIDRLAEHFAKHKGLTIRAHFAAMAMQGLVANPETVTGLQADRLTGQQMLDRIALSSVSFADALIKALNK